MFVFVLMIISLTIGLASVSAIFVHLSVRNRKLFISKCLLSMAVILLLLAFYFGRSFGGFWPGVYTVMSIFIMTTTITPWCVYLWNKSNDS